ncbi:UDP-3-O-(3-hydroxymyristoyl)glucosamine N-acyltransferase [Verrucomicrobium sp. BvORR106]|uniref:UDP-3-O-(3-hydroxymyristoyl)glucosamine N-acyltransferase n=1 Tax=Verrucomicrobium sp. BvORR106 TaxID=1403819 RepID=UPI00056EB288|nr:UDP-3-O-(3-hydroxymyristoyl)glucosamine N-acyltransferase [Verrucomicrobium sp. BvORR106]
MNILLKELAALLEGNITQGDPELLVTGFSSIQEAEPGDITFLGNPRYAPALKKSRASVVLTGEDFQDVPKSMAVIRVSNPTLQFSLVIQKFSPPKREFQPGVHPTAVIGETAKLNRERVYIGPHVVIEEDVEIGDGTAIHAGSFVGQGARLGEGCLLHAHAVVKDRSILGNRVIIHSGAMIGTDGFGYEFSGGRHVKIDQIGIVQVDDDVEIGSCTVVDRARFGRTRIGEGSKIDNLVQIAHNASVGKHCLIVSQVGISGSSRLGNYVIMAGQSGVAGHLTIGDKVTVMGRGGVTKDLPEPGSYMGFPARPLMEGRRAMAYPGRVPNILDRLKAMEKRVQELEGKLGPQQA